MKGKESKVRIVGSQEGRPAAEGALGTECPVLLWWQLFSQLWKKKALSFGLWSLPSPRPHPWRVDRESVCQEGLRGRHSWKGAGRGRLP